MNIIETLINGNISDAKKKAKNRGFMKLVEDGKRLGFSAIEAWNHAAFLKGFQTWEEYCSHK